jgi:hypothetical protein
MELSLFSCETWWVPQKRRKNKSEQVLTCRVKALGCGLYCTWAHTWFHLVWSLILVKASLRLTRHLVTATFVQKENTLLTLNTQVLKKNKDLELFSTPHITRIW